MGSGSFSNIAYASYVSTRTIDNTTGLRKAVHETFESTGLKPSMKVGASTIREARDSEEHPTSNAVILALDVTGSMGFIADELVATGLGRLLGNLLETNPIEHPQMLLMALGDIRCDQVPLQVGQFESDIRVAKQTEDMYLEGNGGGNDTESYDLPWYFAANNTAIDCFEKRGKKGYLFTIGDEMFPTGLLQGKMKDHFGYKLEKEVTGNESLRMAQEKYNVFHLVIEQGSYAARNPKKVGDAWKEHMGKCAIPLDNYLYMPEVIAAAIRINEGADPISVLQSFDAKMQPTLKHAFDL